MTERLGIATLITADHGRMRLGFAGLDEAPGQEELSNTWDRLSTRLETHVDAEERLFYPELVHASVTAQEASVSLPDDHKRIRDAIRDADIAPVGSDAWWEAVRRARTASTMHFAVEERQVLPDFRNQASEERLTDLGEAWQRLSAALAPSLDVATHTAGRMWTSADPPGGGERADAPGSGR